MKIKTIERYSDIFYKVLEYYQIFEEVLEDYTEYNQLWETIKDFLVDYLDDAYDDLIELKENIYHVEVPKKKEFLAWKEKEKFIPRQIDCVLVLKNDWFS